ncbi:N,N-dimethylformamidase beta subunit [Fusarium agapanthi]|uniref:N,N-dimethylformamidase beta subunit n=1 Tax=Fusarium agapanthi TaxID=1803897 RepID=A0A9P5E6R1_9HYPO|nr:N,N-dimethylformamidase beta subunit [Fusarium agapanthi]
MVASQYPVRPALRHDEEEITGYVDPWVVSPGETAHVKISSTKPKLRYQLVRPLQGLDIPHAPAPAKEVIEHGPKGELTGRFQASHPGSYAVVDAWRREPLLGKSEGVEIDFYVQPWMLNAPHPQAILSNLDAAKSAAKEFHLQLTHIASGNETAPSSTTVQSTLSSTPRLDSSSPMYFAATTAASPTSASQLPVHFFNGRIEAPRFKALGRKNWDIARYDLSVGIHTDEISDVSGSGLDGVLVNAPTRAIRGHDWDHKLIGLGWKEATYGFGTIHFHDDDLDDATWDTDFEFTVPSDLRSGAYAIEVQDTESDLKDSIVFFVRPKASQDCLCIFDVYVPGMVRRHDLGLAIYDLHSDGSGVVYSTTKRPILNERPDYIHWGFQRPREFSADLLMVGFLEKHFGDGYDILTDHDLHLRGRAALSQYDVVISGSHPEYPSAESLDAYEGHAKNGVSLIYAGGNGFYWKSVTDPKRPHRMEVRSADVGARTHENPPGERHHALNGQLGGLWRSIGRPPNELWGIGSCASGKEPGRSFIPTDEALNNPSLEWLWKGLNEESRKLLGTKGLAGGASGDELDLLDVAIGSPANANLLARSERHDDHFMLFNEELIFPLIRTLGSTSSLVRSDMVYYETNGGDSVFSVGSINWNNSLAWDGYQNDVAQVTENVIREFLARGKKNASA